MKKVYFLFILVFLSCKPPRNNPYDPKSPNYIGEGVVKGRVTNTTGVPLYGAILSTIPIKFATESDSNGFFILTSDPRVWQLVATKEGYVPETTHVHIAVGETTEVNFFLNGLPIIQSAWVISCHEDRGWPVGSIYWADVWGEVQDFDGPQDIDSVWVIVELESTIIKKYLSRWNMGYGIRIYADSCPNGDLESLIGRPFILCTVDKKGAIGISTTFYLPRIIYSVPRVVSPTYGDTLSQSLPIDFVWQGVEVSYTITYRLIIQNWPTMDTVLTKGNIMETTTTIDPMPPATYLWRVEGKDDFGDISRSSTTMFVVK
ncbi:MAG: carboxypeptidase-like regulatory domain-containing protein [bacterium]|nr:carboxypeptidase-like regulatory domain-containing protein [bacterium]